jgi:hypothetical protein
MLKHNLRVGCACQSIFLTPALHLRIFVEAIGRRATHNKEGNHNFPCEGIMPYSWKGHLKFSLVTIPVRFYSAVDTDADEIHFNQLHRDCHSRIRYQKTCPVHGEITQDQIVLGYEYEKGKYVIVEKDELEALQSDAEK